MAKRNQVTVDLKIAADAQLKGSQNFIRELNNLVDNFDFGTKMNNQIEKAKNQLTDYNKVLAKVQSKSIISDEELKELTKVSKEISTLTTKTENLYKNFNNADWNKYSKKTIALERERQEAIAKIKQQYSDETGKNYDKDFANLDKLKEKAQSLQKAIKDLNNSKQNRINNKIQEENKYYQSQLDTLNEIKRIQNELNNSRKNVINDYSKQTGFTQQELTSKITTDKKTVQKELSNEKYNDLVNTYNQLQQKKEAILNSGKKEKTIIKNLIQLANQYNLANVKTLEDFEKQSQVLEKQKNFYRNLNNRQQLVTEQEITKEIDRRNKLLEAQANMNNDIVSGQKAILSSTSYDTVKDLSARQKQAEKTLSSAKLTVTNTTAQLNSSGEEGISTEIVAAIKEEERALLHELQGINSSAQKTEEYNQKIATQTERSADEQDVVNGANKQIAATNADGDKTRTELGNKISEMTPEDASKIKGIGDTYKSKRFASMATDAISSDGSYDIESATIKTATQYERLISGIEYKFEELTKIQDSKQIEKSAKEILKSISDIEKEGDTLLNNALMELGQKAAALQTFLEAQSHKPGRKSQETNRRIAGAKQFLDNVEENKVYLTYAHDTAKASLNAQKTQIENIMTGKQDASSLKNFNSQTIGNNAAAMENLSKQTQKAAEETQYLGSVYDDFKNKVGYFLSMNYVFDTIVKKVKEASNFIQDLDKDMVQIGLVLGQTSSQTWKNFDTYAKMADRLNTTVSDVTASMKLFYQQGLNTAEVNKMVEASAIAAALGESSMAEASETLTSIINSYNLSANQAISVTDKISMVAMVSAADFGELSVAIEKVASSAASAGLDLDHMMGYLAKMIETTREAPTNVGTALKTIVANFTQFKEDPSAINEDGSDINKVDKALKSVGISLTDTNGDVKDLSEVLDELGGKWNSLTRNQKSYLATQIAGTRQQSRFYALMNDYDRTLQLVEESTNSDGKATEQFALYQESLTASTERLNNEWEKFYNSIAKNDNYLKAFKGTMTGVLKVANQLGPIWSAIFGAGALKGIRTLWVKFSQVREEIQDINKNARDFRTVYQNITSAQGQITDKKNTLDVFKGYTYAGANANGALGQFNVFNKLGKFVANKRFSKSNGAELVETAETWTQLEKAIDGTTAADENFVKSNKKLLEDLLGQEETNNVLNKSISVQTRAVISNQAAVAAEAAEHTISTSIKWAEVAATLALNAAIAALALLAYGAVKGITHLMNKQHEQALATQEQAKASKEEHQNLEELINKYEELNNKIVLTDAERDELKNTISELAEAYPELVEGIDAEGNAYLMANSKLKEYLKTKELEAANDLTASADASLNDKKQTDNAYKDKSGIKGASKNADNFIAPGIKTAAEKLQNALDNYENNNGGFANIARSYSTKDDVEKMEEAIAASNFDKVAKIIEKRRKADSSYKYLKDEEKRTRLQELDRIEQSVASYRTSVQTGYADLAKNKYTGKVTQYAQENNFSDVQTNVANSLLQKYYKEQMKNYNTGDEMRKAIKDGKLTEGVDEILENVSLLTQNEIDDYNKLIENYKTGKLSLDDLEGNLDDYSDSIKELAQNYIKDAQEEIEKMAGVDTDQYNEVDLGKGNIDLNKRPTYTNPDGSVSTVDSVSVNLDGIETLLPSVWQNADGTVTHADAGTEEGMQQILAHYEETGEYLGKFKTALEADTYALELHEKQAQQQDERNNGEEIKQRRIENLSQVSGKTRELLATNKANFREGSDFTKDQYEIAYKNALDNPDFLKDLDKLDKTDLAKVNEFKQKYAQALGEFGEKYIRELTKQKYDAEKTQSSLTKAQQGMTTQNKNGVSFSDISQGSVSQEDAFNELTNSAENARRNITTVGQDLIVTGQEIAQSFEESQREALNSLQGIINNAEDNIKDYKKQLDNWDKTGFDNLADEEKEQYKQIQLNILSEQNRITQAKKLAEAYQKVTIEQEAINKNQNVITGFEAVNKEINSLKDLADMYQYVGNARMSQLDIIQAVAENTDLLTALEVNEQGELYLSKQGIEAIAAERIGEAKATVDAQIAKLEAMKGMINGDEVYSEYELKMLENMAEQWINMSEDQKNALIAQAQQLGYNVQSMDDWTKFVQQDLNGAIEVWNKYHEAVANGNVTTTNTGGSGGNVRVNGANNTKKTVSGAQKKEEIQAEIDRLKAVSAKLGKYQANPSSLLKDINKMGDYKDSGGKDSGGGSGDEYDQKIEKLEHFYNYLRQIEKLEAKIERLRTKRSILDTTENYYVDNLIKENKLLKEQTSLYDNYINAQKEYLAQMRQELSSKYGDWVGFDSEGAAQVKRVNYAIKSEAQEERYNDYSELLNEYQSQYQTYLESQNTLLSTQQTIIENIKSAYEKINQQMEDTMSALERVNTLNEHYADLSVGNIKQLTAYNKQLSSTVDMYNFAAQSLANLKADMNNLTNMANSNGYGQYMQWDATQNQYRTNDNFNNAVTNGTIDNETVTTIQSMVAASQALNDEWEQMSDKMNDIESSLKSIIENRLSVIEELVGGWKDELSDLFDIISREISTKDTVMDLVGYDTGDLEDKYKLVANAAAMTKTSWEETQKLTKQALDNLTKDYGDYVKMINGSAFIDEKGIQESTTLTDLQKERAQELITTYKQLKEATDILEDSTYDYLNALKELQEKQLSQTIDVLQKIHDELKAIDQEELDDLQKKYDKMNQLDSEYYSKLSQRITDFRNKRNEQQQQQDLVQKQNQLAALQRDNSGQYNGQINSLQSEINQSLQSQADTKVDNDLEKISREQDSRAEERDMQLQQLENLINFKDENKVYWEQANAMLNEGFAAVSGFLASREQNADQSELATQEAIAQTNQQLVDIYANLGNYSVKDLQTSADIKQALNDFLTGSGSGSMASLLEKLGVVGSDVNSNLITQFTGISQIINNGFSSSFGQIQTGLNTFWQQFSQLRGNITGNLTTTREGIANSINANGNQITDTLRSSIGRVSSQAASIGATDAQIQKNTRDTANSAGSTAGSAGTIANNTRTGGGGRSVADVAQDAVNKEGENNWLLDATRHLTAACSDSLLSLRRKIVLEGWTFSGGSIGVNWPFSLTWNKSKIYKKGGYANYTGPAWVDGTKSKPEAFLNARQTKLFEVLRDSLSNVPTHVASSDNSTNENVKIENLTIDVKELADTDSVDKVVKTVKESIYKDATSGNNMKITRRR